MALTAKLRNKNVIQAKTMVYSAVAGTKLSDLEDVNISERNEGSLIIWDDTAQQFKVNSRLENDSTFIVGGTF